MLNTISEKISTLLVNKEDNPEEWEACAYGIEISLYSFISTAGLLLIGYLFSFFYQTSLLIVIYYGNQTTGGGYHASSHSACFITMAFGLLTCILIIQFKLLNVAYALLLGIISGSYLWFNPLHLHNNKKYLSFRKESLIKRSRAIIACSAVIIFLMSVLSEDYLYASVMGFFSAAVSRAVCIKVDAYKSLYK